MRIRYQDSCRRVTIYLTPFIWGITLLLVIPLPIGIGKAGSEAVFLGGRSMSTASQANLAGAAAPYWNPVYPTNGFSCNGCYVDPGGLVYDASSGYDVLVGCSSQGQTLVWVFASDSWKGQAPGSGFDPPCPFNGHPPPVYDGKDHALVMLAGNGSTTATWSYANGSWNIVADGGPMKVLGPTPDFAYDVADQAVVWFGGFTQSVYHYGLPPYNANQTWLFRNGTWTNLTPSLAVSPPPDGCEGDDSGHYHGPCTRSIMTYDPMDRAILLTGVGPHTDQTWEFSHDRWLNITSTAGPGPGYLSMSYGWPGSGFACDPIGGLCLVQTYQGEFWPKDYANLSSAFAGDKWASLPFFLEPGNTGYSRTGPMTFDESLKRILLLTEGRWSPTQPEFQQWELTYGTLPAGPSITSVTVTPFLSVLGQSISIGANSAGGIGALSFSFRHLPPGCNGVNTSRFSCTPITSGSFSATVDVRDYAGRTSHLDFSVTILSVYDAALLGATVVASTVVSVILVRRLIRKRRRTPDPPRA